MKKMLLLLLICGVMHATMVPDDSLIYKKPFKKVVLWGHKLHSHTHSWIHWAFYRAFEHLGYDVLWLDNSDNIKGIDFSDSLFITEGQVDHNMPLREDGRYILHNCDSKRYNKLRQQGKVLTLQVYTDKCRRGDVEQVDDFCFFDRKNNIVYMPWATDLLPCEVDQSKEKLLNADRKMEVHWIGTIGGQKFGNIDQIAPFKRECAKHNINFIHHTRASMEENERLIRRSVLAPAIVGAWQEQEGYIPCRIFKNISYGHIGVTNSKAVADLFKGRVVYNKDTAALFHDAVDYLKKVTVQELYDVMDFVRDHHTYLNRIDLLFNVMHEIKPLC